MGRTGCAYVPRFELAVRARGEPGLWEQPVASIDWASRPPRILCATPAAERLGVKVGQIASRARGRLPELICLAPDPVLSSKADREVLSALALIAPRLDSDGRGTFFLGLEGMERLWPNDPAVHARLTEIFGALGLAARFAIADTPFQAWGEAVWGQGKKGATLDQVPLAELGLSEPARELCALLGLRTAGSLARLPPGTLASRLGAEGLRLERLCRGEDFPLWPTAQKLPREAPSVELEFELALEGLEPLLHAFRSLLERLCSLVAAERLALWELQVQARLDDRTEHLECFTPEAPTLAVQKYVDLICLWLERRPFGSPIARLKLTAKRTGPASAAQLSLLRQQEELAASARAKAIAQLSAAFGAAAVTRPVLCDTFRPERRLSWVPALGTPLEGAKSGKSISAFAPLGLVLRQVDPPERVAIGAGKVLHRVGRATARIVQIDAPQRLAGEWWGDRFDRTYTWLRLETGELCWVFREERTGGVFLQATGD